MTQLLPLNAIENPPSLRNFIINGCCRIGQRGAQSLVNNAYTYAGADRIMGYPNSFTSCVGTLSQASGLAGTISGYAQQALVTTTGTGSMIFATRLEARDVARLNGKTVTISAKVYHDTGSALNSAIQLYKANAADNFSGVTQIGTTVTTGSVATSTWTKISATFTLGATDASNGLLAFVQFQSVGAVTSKNFYIGEWQLEQGSVASEFDMRPFALENALCKRYFRKQTIDAVGYQAAASGVILQTHAIDEMRIAPAVSQFANNVNLTQANVTTTTSTYYTSVTHFSATRLTTAAGTAQFSETVLLNAEL